MSKSKTLVREINGKPYFFTRNKYGWGVTSAEKRTDRFHRSYQVWCDGSGRPMMCSCPHCHKACMWCKHLKAVEALYREQNPEAVEEIQEQAASCGIPVEPTRDQLVAAGLLEGPDYRDFPPPKDDDPEAYTGDQVRS